MINTYLHDKIILLINGVLGRVGCELTDIQ